MSEWGVHEPLLGGIWTTQGGLHGSLGIIHGSPGVLHGSLWGYMGPSGDTWVPRVIHGLLG